MVIDVSPQAGDLEEDPEENVEEEEEDEDMDDKLYDIENIRPRQDMSTFVNPCNDILDQDSAFIAHGQIFDLAGIGTKHSKIAKLPKHKIKKQVEGKSKKKPETHVKLYTMPRGSFRQVTKIHQQMVGASKNEYNLISDEEKLLGDLMPKPLKHSCQASMEFNYPHAMIRGAESANHMYRHARNMLRLSKDIHSDATDGTPAVAIELSRARCAGKQERRIRETVCGKMSAMSQMYVLACLCPHIISVYVFTCSRHTSFLCVFFWHMI